jgi:cholesterol transport system auxiliary component
VSAHRAPGPRSALRGRGAALPACGRALPWCTALLLTALLAGCSGLFRSTARPEQIYYLRAAGAPAAPAAAATSGAADASGEHAPSALALAASVRVGHPVIDPGLDSSHIMLLQPDHRMNFYGGARWPAALPEVIETLTVETLSASGEWAAVVDSTSPFPADYLLQVAVRRFDADYTAGGAAPVVHVTLDCIIGRREGRDVIATFVVAASAPAAANRLGEVVGAFEQATREALGSLSQRAAQAARADEPHAPHDGRKPVAAGAR